MALKLIASYSKRLGLPEYSSHQFSVTIEAELTGVGDIAGESARLYDTLQNSVDEQIQQTGFVPAKGYGNGQQTNGNGHHNGNDRSQSNGNGAWQCSDKQRDLILKVIEQNKLDKADIEKLSRDRFDGKGVKQLNKLEASGLIDELLERVGEKPNRGRTRRNGPPAYTNGGGR